MAGATRPSPEPLPVFRGYDTLSAEVTNVDLPITGAFPEWLEGTLIRNGPAMFDIGDHRLTHWFDGLAMLHRFAFRPGSVRYTNRYLRTQSYLTATTEQRLYAKQFGMDPCEAAFGRHRTEYWPVVSDNTNVNIFRFNDRFVAVQEQLKYTEFDPRTLDTVGDFTFEQQTPGFISSPHPHYDHRRGMLLNYASEAENDECRYRLFGVPDGTEHHKPLATIATDAPCYMHSFALTEKYVVLVEFPVVFDPASMRRPQESVVEGMRWRPERPARFRVVSLDAGVEIATFESPAFFAFHHINAFERGRSIIVDIAAARTPHDTVLGLPATAETLDLEPQRYSVSRYVLDLGNPSGGVEPERLAEVGVEMPRINYRGHNGRDYRYVYGLGHSPKAAQAMNRLHKIDVVTGTHRTWYQKACFPGEPVFVARPGAAAEDDGVVLAGVMDLTTVRAFLLVLDGRTFEELGRAAVPHHLPADFHGQYFTGI